MAIISESNFPNSRVTASLLAIDYSTNLPLAITGENVPVGPGLSKNALNVQFASAAGGNVNIAQVGGNTVDDYNFANPMVPKGYDSMIPTFNATSDVWEFRKGGLAGTIVATQTINYTDATKNVILNIVTVY